jgi:parallel beta-helix repeat protein
MSILQRLIMAGIIIAATFVQTSPASTVVVGGCKSGPQYSTIQDAVNHSSAGGTIDVCPGTYAEQVSINISLTLTGVPNGTVDSIVITPPTGGMVQNASDLYDGSAIAAQIVVLGGATVNLSNLTIDGTNNQISGCGPDFMGIYYQNSSGKINYVVTRNQALSANLNGCQSGEGIFVESGYGSGGTATVTIENSSVHGYQKNGITADGSGTAATITGNYVVGQGPTTGAAENGIQISDGATGKVTSNEVVDDVYTGGIYGASGILVYDSGSLTIASNTVSDTQYGIVVFSDGTLNADNNTISGNHISATHLDDGIDLCSNGNTVKSNFVSASDASGIHIDSTCSEGGNPTGNNTTVSGNTVNEACAGVLLGNGTGNTIGANSLFSVGEKTFKGDSCPGGDDQYGRRPKRIAVRR